MQADDLAMINMEVLTWQMAQTSPTKKQASSSVNGYQDIDQKASGDGHVLVYKVAKKFRKK